MTVYRIPVLVWEDVAGDHHACPVEWNRPVGLGRTAAEALEQVEDCLAWYDRHAGWRPEPDFLDPALGQFLLAIRPQYEVDGRPFPCDEAFPVRVPYVRGRRGGGLLACCVPTLDVRFYYSEADKLDDLLARYLRQELEGLTPRELARRVPPRRVELARVVVRVPADRVHPRDEPAPVALQAVAEPLGERRLVRRHGRAWGREEQVADLVSRLGRDRDNVLLVGEPSAGKTTVLVQAVQTLERRAEPGDGGGDDAGEERVASLRRYWRTSAARLIAGMQYLGQWEERCEQIVEELGRIGGVLCVESLLDLVRTGGQSPSNGLAAFFLPYLRRRELRMVAETTPAELDACRRLLPGLADVFQVLDLPEFTRAQALAVLDGVARSAGQELGLEVPPGVVDAVERLFRRFAPYQAFPGQAAAFLSDLLACAERARAAAVAEPLVVAQFIRRTGLPEWLLRDELPLRHEEVCAHFARQVIGQEEACRAAADLVTTYKAGLNDPGRPVGVLLFCGPTGVGKTELAKALARYAYGHGEQPDRLIRLDMSEYAGPDAADRLVARADGEPSDLIRRLRRQPFAVVLLDEIEKADPGVFDVLLSVCDEGRLTDGYGRVTTFRGAILILTSNLGADRRGSVGYGDPPPVRYDVEARTFFRPEFFNRLDAVVTFHPLGAETIRSITCKELAEIARREGLARRGLRLRWTEAAVATLARAGFHPRYGARPLQRTLETLVVAPLARLLLDHPSLRESAILLDLGPRGTITLSGPA